ncbi:MAG TPA: recombination regulator RecX [Cutibacterium acnes]|nr:recombination regulator RecX [Cutibacterium acnes]
MSRRRQDLQPELTDDQWYEEAREICLKRLDRRANTRGELADVLDSKGVPEPVREAVLDRLTEVGLIDDADFANRWTASRHGMRGLSRRAVAAELSRKGVDSHIIEDATSQITDADELDAATELAITKLRAGYGIEEARLTRRVLGTLARKGYGPHIAWAAICAARDELGEEPPEVPTTGLFD